MWRILERLTSDPTLDDVGGDITTAINSVRGRALANVFAYADWVRRGDSTRGSSGVLIPEALKVLEAHLDPLIDSSPAIRALYGYHMWGLFSMGASWFAQLKPRLFPVEASAEGLRDAAWATYVSSYRANDALFMALQDVYAQEIERTATAAPDDVSSHNLGQHLAILFARQALPDEGAFLYRYFALASDKVRAGTISFIGRVLRADKNRPVPEIRERFERFWRERLAALRDSPEGSSLELAAFASWLASDAVDPGATGLLVLESARLRGGLSVSYSLLVELVAIAPKYPQVALDLFEQFLEGERDSDQFLWHEREIRSILVASRDAGGHEIEPQLTRVVSRLSARGSPAFVTVLTPGASVEESSPSSPP